MSTHHLHCSSIARAAAIAAALSLAACGGGGGSKTEETPIPPSGRGITLGGVVSKGLTGNADVKVLGIKASNGEVDEGVVLATGTTNDKGVYSTTEFIAPLAYVVEVSAKTCADTVAGTGCSFHQDEKTQAKQYLPTGFKMRAVVTLTPSSRKVNITPLSEMAVAAAEHAVGGLTQANAEQALTMVNTLVGVLDLNAVVPTTLASAQGAEQIRLAALLAAVSGVAGDSSALTDVGCASFTPGTPESTKCVVEKLAANATLTTYQGSSVAVTAALDAQLTAAVAGNAEATAAVVAVSDRLTHDHVVPTPEVASAIDKVKAFFADLTSTVRALLDSGTTPGQGAVLEQAHQFETAVSNVDFQADATVNSARLMIIAAKLWSDFDQGSSKNKASFDTDRQWFEGDSGCQLVKSDGSDWTPPDGRPAMHGVHCWALSSQNLDWSTQTSNLDGTTNMPTEIFYTQFAVNKVAGKFHYVAHAHSTKGFANVDFRTSPPTLNRAIIDAGRQDFCPQSSMDGDACTGMRKFSGDVTTTTDGSGRLASAHIVGELPDAWKSHGMLSHASAGTNNAAKSTIDLNVTLTATTYSSSALDASLLGATLGLQGGNVTFGSNGTTEESRTTFGAGSQMVMADQMAQNVTLNLTMLTPSSKVVGVLTFQGTTNNDGGTSSFTGELYNLSQSATAPFIRASLAVTIDNSHYDELQPYSSTNYSNGTLHFDGYITAPQHPKLRLVMAAAGRKTDPKYVWGMTASQDTASGTYTVYNADGSTKREVGIDVTSPNHDGKATITFSDVANGISFSLLDDQTVADVLVTQVKTGELDTDNSRLTFTTGEFMSVDFGTVLYSH